jgi:hypothetical protein
MPRATRSHRHSRTNCHTNDLPTSNPCPRRASATRNRERKSLTRSREKKPHFTSFLKSEAGAEKSSDVTLQGIESYTSFEPLGISDSPPQLGPLPWETYSNEASWLFKLGDLWGTWETAEGGESPASAKKERKSMGSGDLDGFTFDFEFGPYAPVAARQSMEETPSKDVIEHWREDSGIDVEPITETTPLPISFDEPTQSTGQPLPDTTTAGTEMGDFETFAQTRIPLDSISFQSSPPPGSQIEDEYPDWTVLFQEDENEAKLEMTQEHTLLQQLLARPLPQKFLEDAEILEWLCLDGLEADTNQSDDDIWDSYSEWFDDDWDVMPHARDVEAHQRQSAIDV